ncbi:B12-binding domain-containing radical SAM protein [Embleya sp. NPDC055664]
MTNSVDEEPTSAGADIRFHDAGGGAAPAIFQELLSTRRHRLATDLAAGRTATRYFPVLCVLAPVMTQAEGEITYPGDPMCLYAALSLAVHRAVADAGRLQCAEHYNDLAPEWTRFPDHAYRMTAGHDGYRDYGTDPNTDQTVFDPRIWDETARVRWIRLLRRVRPRVVLISAVSPAHRYALEIAGLVRTEVPDAFVVLGGRHADETVIRVPHRERLVLAPSSPLAVIADGRAPRVFDAVITGEAYHSLDLLMRALALATDLDRRWVDRDRVLPCLQGLLDKEGPSVGSSVIVLLSASGFDVLPQDGSSLDLGSLPSPYEAFAIRSRFPIFTHADGGIRRTAHVMVSNACPYHCNFCSESSTLGIGLKRFREDPIGRALERVCEYVGYGAEALFFDDSVFWSGRSRDIAEFCGRLRELRRSGPAALPVRFARLLPEPDDPARLRNLEWGAQLTVDTLIALRERHAASEILNRMREAGCSYVYVGIESMSTQVMDHIHKNLRRGTDRPWAHRVREAVSLVKRHGMRVGTSVLFGLDGETRGSIDETIEAVGGLIDARLIDLASPNILTYHPATPITRVHGMHDRLDYHSPRVDNRRPYTYFEEAFPGVVSVVLAEDDIWHIHRETERRWGAVRNDSSPLLGEGDGGGVGVVPEEGEGETADDRDDGPGGAEPGDRPGGAEPGGGMPGGSRLVAGFVPDVAAAAEESGR